MARVGRGKLARALAFALTACASIDASEDARESQIVSLLAAADEPYIRGRPELSAGKYVRMSSGVFDFYRGTVPVWRSDVKTGTTTAIVSSFAIDIPLVPSIGDPHPENFGVLWASDGTAALEPNDFDAADHAPYLWDVRRLAAGMALAALESNPEDEAARQDASSARYEIVKAAVLGYRLGIEDAARGALNSSTGRVTSDGEVAKASPVLKDLFKRSSRDFASRRELSDLVEATPTGRRIRRGVIDPEDPQGVHLDLPPFARAELDLAIAKYRETLLAPPPPSFFRVVDAVRKLGGGVASWARIRLLVLIEGPSDSPDDDVILELKEITDSTTAGLYPPFVYADSVGDRVLRTSRAAWARPDAEPFWGVTSWLGFPCQVRRESEGQKGVRVARLADTEGTVEAIRDLGAILGRLVARVHSSGEKGEASARAIYKQMATDPERFVIEQADFGVAYAERVREDQRSFLRAVHRSEVGLRLGVPFDPIDSPSPDLKAVYGTPPPPPPLPPLP